MCARLALLILTAGAAWPIGDAAMVKSSPTDMTIHFEMGGKGGKQGDLTFTEDLLKQFFHCLCFSAEGECNFKYKEHEDQIVKYPITEVSDYHLSNPEDDLTRYYICDLPDFTSYDKVRCKKYERNSFGTHRIVYISSVSKCPCTYIAWEKDPYVVYGRKNGSVPQRTFCPNTTTSERPLGEPTSGIKSVKTTTASPTVTASTKRESRRTSLLKTSTTTQEATATSLLISATTQEATATTSLPLITLPTTAASPTSENPGTRFIQTQEIATPTGKALRENSREPDSDTGSNQIVAICVGLGVFVVVVIVAAGLAVYIFWRRKQSLERKVEQCQLSMNDFSSRNGSRRGESGDGSGGDSGMESGGSMFKAATGYKNMNTDEDYGYTYCGEVESTYYSTIVEAQDPDGHSDNDGRDRCMNGEGGLYLNVNSSTEGEEASEASFAEEAAVAVRNSHERDHIVDGSNMFTVRKNSLACSSDGPRIPSETYEYGMQVTVPNVGSPENKREGHFYSEETDVCPNISIDNSHNDSADTRLESKIYKTESANDNDSTYLEPIPAESEESDSGTSQHNTQQDKEYFVLEDEVDDVYEDVDAGGRSCSREISKRDDVPLYLELVADPPVYHELDEYEN